MKTNKTFIKETDTVVAQRTIELLKFKYAVAEKYIHSLFNAEISRQIGILGFFVALLQIDFGSYRIESYYLLLILLGLSLIGSHINYRISISKTGRTAVELENAITAKYQELGVDLRVCFKGGKTMSNKQIKILYTNYKNETAIRTIVPKELKYGKTEYHPEEQWLLVAWDCEKQAERTFAMKDVMEWRV